MGKTKRGKGAKIITVADGSSCPVAISVSSTSPHEVGLVETTLEGSFVQQNPDRLVGDRAYDSDELDEELKAKGIEMITP